MNPSTSWAPACTPGANGAATSPNTASSHARAALAEAGLDWKQIQLVAGADTIRNGYPGFVAGATFAQKLGWNGIPVTSSYAACASGSGKPCSPRAPRSWPASRDVALVIGADTTPKGFFAPVGGERRNDPDWQRFHLIGATNTVYRRPARPAGAWTSTAPPCKTSRR